MQKHEWLAIAETLRARRMAVKASWPPPPVQLPSNERDMTFPAGLAAAQLIHERKVAYLAELAGLNRTATMLAATIDHTTNNFDPKRFLRIVAGSN